MADSDSPAPSKTAERPPLPELFHAIADQGSAAARRRLVELDLSRRVRIRNVAYPEVEADLRARSGGALTTPAFWDGATLLVGEAAVLAALDRLAATGG